MFSSSFNNNSSQAVLTSPTGPIILYHVMSLAEFSSYIAKVLVDAEAISFPVLGSNLLPTDREHLPVSSTSPVTDTYKEISV